MAEWFPNMFWNFYFVKDFKIANNSNNHYNERKISTYVESLELYKFFDTCFTRLKTNYLLLIKISHRFILTTKLFTGWKSLIWSRVYITCTYNNLYQQSQCYKSFCPELTNFCNKLECLSSSLAEIACVVVGHSSHNQQGKVSNPAASTERELCIS